MNKKEITITISGSIASGKSRILYAIKKYLEEEGYDVSRQPTLDHPTEDNFNNMIGKNNDEVIDYLKDITNVKLVETTINNNICFYCGYHNGKNRTYQMGNIILCDSCVGEYEKR